MRHKYLNHKQWGGLNFQQQQKKDIANQLYI